jgi:hypothetical protein
LGVLVIVALSNAAAWGQEPPDELYIPEDSDYHQLSPEDRSLVDQMVAELRGSVAQRRFSKPKRVKPSGEPPTQVVKHLRGSEGIPFNEAVDEELQHKAEQMTEQLRPQIEQSGKALAEHFTEDSKKYTTPAEVKPCLVDEVVREATPINSPHLSSSILYDLLFLPKELAVNNPEAFGSVDLGLVTPENAKFAFDSVEWLGLNCVPSRIRITTGGTERYTGLLALKNYDRKAEGELDEQVRLQWEEYMRQHTGGEPFKR